MKRNKYRYITSGLASTDGRVCDYRLVTSAQIRGTCNSNLEAIRICVNDIKLEKYRYDGFSTTTDKRLLSDLGAQCLIFVDGKWEIHNEFYGIPEHRWYGLLKKSGYICSFPYGYSKGATTLRRLHDL